MYVLQQHLTCTSPSLRHVLWHSPCLLSGAAESKFLPIHGSFRLPHRSERVGCDSIWEVLSRDDRPDRIAQIAAIETHRCFDGQGGGGRGGGAAQGGAQGVSPRDGRKFVAEFGRTSPHRAWRRREWALLALLFARAPILVQPRALYIGQRPPLRLREGLGGVPRIACPTSSV